MRIRLVTASVVCVCVLALFSGPVWAAKSAMRVDIPFEFATQKGTLASGAYEILIDGPQGNLISLRSIETGKVIRLSISTRLADVGAKKAYFVFDKTGGEHFLSEIHIPNADGYALKGASKDHQHELVPVKE